MLFALILACPDPTYDVPTTYNLPTENPGSPDDQKPNNGNPDGDPNGNPNGDPNGQGDPSGDYDHQDMVHKEMPPGTPQEEGRVPEADAPPPPPQEDLENSGDEPPPSDRSIIANTPGEPAELPEHPKTEPLDPSPEAISFENGCIISHQWEKLRSQEVEKINFKTSLDTTKPVQTLLVDFVSPKTHEVQVGIICPSKEIDINIPKNLGQVQLAIFVDNNENGPSADDLQALSELFFVREESVSMDKIPLSETQISFYNFKEE